METSINLTNYYWDLLKSLSDDVKLRLATRLTASVLEHRKDEAAREQIKERLKAMGIGHSTLELESRRTRCHSTCCD